MFLSHDSLLFVCLSAYRPVTQTSSSSSMTASIFAITFIFFVQGVFYFSEHLCVLSSARSGRQDGDDRDRRPNESVYPRADMEKWRTSPRLMTWVPARAARQNQSSAKLIYPSVCLRATGTDRTCVIVIRVIRTWAAFCFTQLWAGDFTAHFCSALSVSKLF